VAHCGGVFALNAVITPVLIHQASIAASGKVSESEVLTPVDSALSQRALSAVRRCICRNSQREAVVTVEFLSPQ
jgi:hypothetical protein